MIGSSSVEAIEQRPHLAHLLASIAGAGFAITNVDLKSSPNVHIVGDVGDPAVQQQIRELEPSLVMAANLLEHVPDPVRLAAQIEQLVDPGAHIVCTVPRSYPYHADPIDTLFRPTVAELATLFRDCEVVAADEVEAGTFLDLRERPASRGRRLKSYARGVLLGGRSARGVAFAARHGWWIRRPYTVTCMLLRKQPSPVGAS